MSSSSDRGETSPGIDGDPHYEEHLPCDHVTFDAGRRIVSVRLVKFIAGRRAAVVHTQKDGRRLFLITLIWS